MKKINDIENITYLSDFSVKLIEWTDCNGDYTHATPEYSFLCSDVHCVITTQGEQYFAQCDIGDEEFDWFDTLDSAIEYCVETCKGVL